MEKVLRNWFTAPTREERIRMLAQLIMVQGQAR